MSSPGRINKLEQFIGVIWNVKLFSITNLDWNIWEDISQIDLNKNENVTIQKEYQFSL